MKKRIALVLAGCMLFSAFAGCGKTPTAEGDKPTDDPAAKTEVYGTFRNYFLSDVETMNPHTWSSSNADDAISKAGLRLYASSLSADATKQEVRGEWATAEPVKKDEEGLKWEIKIAENAVWENGDKMNVDDFLYSMQMLLDPKLVNSRASQAASDYITIVNAKEYSLQGAADTVKWESVGFKRVDDYTLGLELSAPVTAADVMSHFTYSWMVPVHKATYESCMNADRTINDYGSTPEKVKSCGSFILSGWIPGSQLTYTRNADYIHADNIKLEGYTYKIIKDRNTALELFLNGELDTVSLSPEAIEQYLDDPRVKEAPASSIQTIVINHGNTNNNKVLANQNFRLALFYAIDRESIAKMTNGIPANYLVPSKCLGDTTKGLTFREMPESSEYLADNLGFDKVKAKEYYDKAMQELGLTTLKLTLQYNETSANNKAASEFLHKELPTIFGDSFTLDLMAAPSSVLTTYIKGWKNGDPNSFELQWRGWDSSTTAPWNGMKFWTTSYSNKNEPYYNEAYDKLWDEANLELKAKEDPAYRLELVRQMEKMALEDVAVCPAYEAPGYYLISDKVKLPAPDGGYVPGYGFGYDLATISE